MAITKRLEKLEEAENATLNLEYKRLYKLLQTAFSKEEKHEIAQANLFVFQPMTEKEHVDPIQEVLNRRDLAFKQRVVEGLQRVIKKWRTSLDQRAIDPNWDASSLIDEEVKQVNEAALRRNGNTIKTRKAAKCDKMQQL